MNLAGINVLIVDDDDDDGRALVKRLLDDCGASVIAYSNVNEALARLAKDKFDILVSDIGMPERDGYSFLRHEASRIVICQRLL